MQQFLARYGLRKKRCVSGEKRSCSAFLAKKSVECFTLRKNIANHFLHLRHILQISNQFVNIYVLNCCFFSFLTNFDRFLAQKLSFAVRIVVVRKKKYVMPRKDENLYKRKDDRWKDCYIKIRSFSKANL